MTQLLLEFHNLVHCYRNLLSASLGILDPMRDICERYLAFSDIEVNNITAGQAINLPYFLHVILEVFIAHPKITTYFASLSYLAENALLLAQQADQFRN